MKVLSHSRTRKWVFSTPKSNPLSLSTRYLIHLGNNRIYAFQKLCKKPRQPSYGKNLQTEFSNLHKDLIAAATSLSRRRHQVLGDLSTTYSNSIKSRSVILGCLLRSTSSQKISLVIRSHPQSTITLDTTKSPWTRDRETSQHS